MYSLLKEYGDLNEERFNKDLIYLKDQDDILKHANNIFSALEVINGVEFLESSINYDESTFPEWKSKDSDVSYVNVEESRYVQINFKFRLFDKETNEEEIVEKYLYFPKLINKTYFVLNGSKFYPIFQIIDCCTYNNNGALTLKTLLMLITLRPKSFKFYDVFDNEYSENIRVVDLFKNKLNFLSYFFAEKGFQATMEYFAGEDWEDKILIADSEEYDFEENSDEFMIFALSSKKRSKSSATVLFISKEFYEEKKNFCVNLIEILIDKNEVQIFDKQFWILELGKVFSRNKNSYESKAHDILISFKRILDNSTKENLRLKDENKEDVFAIIRWMNNNFDELIQRDNMDLKYKRIRIYEYLFYDLLLKMSNITYRLLNKPKTNLSDLKQLFSTLGPMFIIKKIGQNELLRYLGVVNAIELFNPSLKMSQRGCQGLGEGSKNVNKEYRGIHPSYLGRIGLTSGSASDPGMTGTFSPFLYNKGFYFSDEMLD